MRTLSRVCVYCGSSNAVDPLYFELARAMGRALVAQDCALVYGGGNVGLMGAIADAVLEAGGRVYGVIPRKLMDKELAHPGCTELFVTTSMSERKLLMAQLSDAVVAMPGGIGTLEELFEALSWTQLAYHDLPVGMLNADGYYDHLRAFLAHAAQVGFIRPVHADLLEWDTDPTALLDKLSRTALPTPTSWLGRRTE